MSLQHVSFQHRAVQDADKKAGLATKSETHEFHPTADQRLIRGSTRCVSAFINRAFPCGIYGPGLHGQRNQQASETIPKYSH